MQFLNVLRYSKEIFFPLSGLFSKCGTFIYQAQADDTVLRNRVRVSVYLWYRFIECFSRRGKRLPGGKTDFYPTDSKPPQEFSICLYSQLSTFITEGEMNNLFSTMGGCSLGFLSDTLDTAY